MDPIQEHPDYKADPKHIWTQYRSTPIIRQVVNDLQRDLDSHTIIVGDINTPLSILDRSDRKSTRISRA